MAVGALKSWVAGEILTASDLNLEFLHVYGGGENLGWPSTKAKDFAGFPLTLDDGGTSSFTADTDNRLDLALNGTDLFRWDGTTGTPVNGLDFVTGETGKPVTIQAFSGTDSNVSINLVPKGTGKVLIDGQPFGDTVLRSMSSNVVARTTKHRLTHIEANHIGEAQSLGF